MIDTKLVFSSDQALTTTAVGTNVIDLGAADSGAGAGTPIYLHCRVTDDADFAGGTSVTFSLQHSDSEGSGYTDILVTPAILTATLVKGAWLFQGAIPLIVSAEKIKRYLGVKYTISGTYTDGKVDCFLSLGQETAVGY